MLVEMRLPALSLTMQEGRIVEWLVSQGDTVAQGQPVVTVEADKAVMDLEAPEGGVVSRIEAPPDAVVPVGAVLAEISTAVQTSVEPRPAGDQKPRGKGRRVSPAARKLARERGVDLDRIEGSGPDGAVVLDDVRQSGEEAIVEETETIVPLSALRRTMRQRMESSRQTVVQATTVTEVDMTDVVKARERVEASFTAFVISGASKAVKDFPMVNASLRDDSIILKSHVHMGVAVDTEEGLLVPVIRKAERMALAEIDLGIEDLAQRARGRTLNLEDLSGATMTVTNSGALGSLFFAPVVVTPQAATLGMGRVTPTPVAREGRIVIKDVMYLSLSYDHRFLDGGIAVRYLQRLREFLENPTALVASDKDRPESSSS